MILFFWDIFSVSLLSSDHSLHSLYIHTLQQCLVALDTELQHNSGNKNDWNESPIIILKHNIVNKLQIKQFLQGFIRAKIIDPHCTYPAKTLELTSKGLSRYMNADSYRICLPWCRSHSHGDHGRALSSQDQSFLFHFCFLPVTDKCLRPPSWRGGQPWWWWNLPGTRPCGRWSLGCWSAPRGQDATRWTLGEARPDIWSARTQSC